MHSVPVLIPLDVTYTYDQRGRLVSLTDWSSQQTQFGYDNVGRHIVTERHNGLRSRYAYDAGGRLQHLRHTKGSQTLADFHYEVDKRGNRTKTQELLAHPATTTDTTIAYDDEGLALTGTWSDVSGFKVTTQFSARLMLDFFGDEATLTMGTGPDHSIYDLYIGGSLWQSFDGYAASEGQRDILIAMGVDSRKLAHEGPHVLEIRNRAEQNGGAQPSHPVVRFKQLVVADKTYALHTIRYDYDNLARLTEARYAPGINAGAGDADLLRRYQYSYDLAGNRVQQIETVAGSPTTTNYTYNAANQMTAAEGATLTYDDNGNLTSDGTNAYEWDRANRLLSMGGVSYAYDGLNNRISQTISSTVTQYLLDLQPGLSVVLAATTGADTNRYIHGPRGIHAQHDAADNWEWMVQDGLGSVRGVADNTGAVQWSGSYGPYGNDFGEVGTAQTMYGFTGEPTNETGLLHLRARDYNPTLGIFTALDPFEGLMQRPMSLNGYSWVEANVPNAVDPSGMIFDVAFANALNNGTCNSNLRHQLPDRDDDKCRCCTNLPAALLCSIFRSLACTCPPEINPPTVPPIPTTPPTVPPTVPPIPTTPPTVPPTVPPPTPTLGSCPTDAVFGCYNDQPGVPIPLVEVGTNHPNNEAIDLVPITAFGGQPITGPLSPSWDQNDVTGRYRTVYAVVRGTVFAYTLRPNTVDFRILTDIQGTVPGSVLCYEYKHLIPSVEHGANVNPGDILGVVNNYLNDQSGPGNAGDRSHLHLAVFPCSPVDASIMGGVQSNIDPRTRLNHLAN